MPDPGGNPMGKTDLSKQGVTFNVPIQPLSRLLDKTFGKDHFSFDKRPIDLWSLDVEGFEVPVLNGVDWTRHRPRYIMIEVQHRDPKVFSKMEQESYKLCPGVNGNEHISGWRRPRPHADYLWRDTKNVVDCGALGK